MRSLAAIATVSTAAAGAGQFTLIFNETKSANAPAPRSGQTTVQLGNTKATITVGGCSSSCCYAPLSDVWLSYQVSDNQLAWVSQSQAAPFGGQLYAAAAPYGANASLVFGGTNVYSFSNELWLATLGKAGQVQWTNPQTSGSEPAVRAGHTMTALPSDASITYYVYGGHNDLANLGDMWTLQAETFTWNQLTTNVGPGPRTQHTLTAVDGSTLLLVAGSLNGGTDSNDAWLFDTVSSTWIQINTGSSTLPTIRHAHVVAMSAPATTRSVGKATAFLYGGQTGTTENAPYLGDAWRLDIVLTRNAATQALTAATGVWTQIADVAAPGRRGLMGLVTLPGRSKSETLMFFGFSGYEGGLNDLFHNDVWAWNL